MKRNSKVNIKEILDLAELGFHFYPMETSGVKAPPPSDWPRKATCDPTILKQKYKYNSTNNWIVVPNERTVIVDLDYIDSVATRLTMEKLFPGGLDGLYGCMSQSGKGMHLYFTNPEGLKFKTTYNYETTGYRCEIYQNFNHYAMFAGSNYYDDSLNIFRWYSLFENNGKVSDLPHTFNELVKKVTNFSETFELSSSKTVNLMSDNERNRVEKLCNEQFEKQINKLRCSSPGEREPNLCSVAIALGGLLHYGVFSESFLFNSILGAMECNGATYEKKYSNVNWERKIENKIKEGALRPWEIDSFVLEGSEQGVVLGDFFEEIETSETDEKKMTKYEGYNNWDEMLKSYEETIKRNFDPIPTGFPMLDEKLDGGFTQGQMVLLCGTAGSGKSTMAASWGLQAAKCGHPVIYWSLELEPEQLASRLACRKGFSWRELRTGVRPDPVRDQIEELRDLNYMIVGTKTVKTHEDLSALIEMKFAETGKYPFIIVDYAQIAGKKAENESQIRSLIDKTSSFLCEMAREKKNVVVIISSVARSGYTKICDGDKKPSPEVAMGLAKESGQFEYDASIVLGLGLYPQADKYGVKRGWLVLAKNRYGGGECAIPIAFSGKSGTFYQTDDDGVRDIVLNIADWELKVYEYVKNNRPKTIDEISKGLQCRKAKASRAMEILIADGRVERDGTRSCGYYQVKESK